MQGVEIYRYTGPGALPQRAPIAVQSASWAGIPGHGRRHHLLTVYATINYTLTNHPIKSSVKNIGGHFCLYYMCTTKIVHYKIVQ